MPAHPASCRHPRRPAPLLVGLLGGLTFAVASCAGGPGPDAAATAGLPQADAARQPASPDSSEIQFLSSILRNPANSPETRTGAAERLLRLDAGPAYVVLADALRSGDAVRMTPVLGALGTAPTPVQEFLRPAVDALAVAPPETLPQLALVLSEFEDEAADLVAGRARDRGAPLAERLNAVYVLGSFATRESGDALLALADPARQEDEAIRAAALASLRRLAPVDLGADFHAWREWWDGVRDKSQAEWAREMVRLYQDRNTALEQLNDDLTRRYIETLRELHRGMDVNAQLERLPRLLNDPLVPVREFAMVRIDRLLRDSVIIPDNLRAELIRSLDDEHPPLRLLAAKILDELAEPTLPDRVAARLPDELDRTVVAGYLELLARRPPAPEALPALLDRLDDELLGPAAAEAVWQLLLACRAAEAMDVEEIAALDESVRLALPADALERPRGKHARLLALVGSDEDAASVVPLLDAPEPERRRAVAEGFCERGSRDVLLNRAADEAVYPSALLVLVEGPADVASFRTLLGLKRYDPAGERWADAVRKLAARLDSEELLDADLALAEVENNSTRLRSDILLHAAQHPADAAPTQADVDVVLRLAPMLIETGQAQSALEIIDGLNGGVASPELTEARLLAALAAGRYDAAALVTADPEAWVRKLKELAPRDGAAASRLCAEIQRRFPKRLEGKLKEDLEAVCQALPTMPASSAGAADEDDGIRE